MANHHHDGGTTSKQMGLSNNHQQIDLQESPIWGLIPSYVFASLIGMYSPNQPKSSLFLPWIWELRVACRAANPLEIDTMNETLRLDCIAGPTWGYIPNYLGIQPRLMGILETEARNTNNIG